MSNSDRGPATADKADVATVLAIDTSADHCSVALIAGDDAWHAVREMARGHAEALLPMIEDVLDRAARGPADLDRIAVCTGPGSFTGIRAGVAAARGMALGLGIPAVGVTRLAALAYARGAGGEIAVPMRGVDWAVQDFEDALTPTAPPRIEARGPAGAPPPVLDPVVLARLGRCAAATGRPAPLYLRPADAAPGTDAPPPILDP